MKTGKWLIVVLVIALVAVYYILGTGYLKLRRGDTDLNTQIEAARATLIIMPPAQSGLEQRLADAEARLTVAESSFSGETDDTLIINNILKLAEKTGLTAIPLSTQPWVVENLFNRNYDVFSMTLSLKGDFSNLQDFIQQLENSGMETLVVKDLKIERDPVITSDNVTSVSSDNVTAYIEIAVYNLTPSAE